MLRATKAVICKKEVIRKTHLEFYLEIFGQNYRQLPEIITLSKLRKKDNLLAAFNKLNSIQLLTLVTLVHRYK